MKKLGYVKDIEQLADVPEEIAELIKGYLRILETVYGADRNIDNSDGGYVVWLEEGDSLEMLQEIDLDVEELTAEYTEIVALENGDKFSNTFVVFNNEFAVNLIMPISMTPKHFLDC